jgi:hypothetical protein
LGENRPKNSLKRQYLVRGRAGGKVMRENEPVLLVLSVFGWEIILEKGEILWFLHTFDTVGKLCWLLLLPHARIRNQRESPSND